MNRRNKLSPNHIRTQKTYRPSNASAKTTSSVTHQVRIIGGKFKRRNVHFIDAEGLRPTPDRVRETLFNWLMNDIYDARVLDTCAGSGVLGFECLSRGASHVSFIEANKHQYQQLIRNATDLKLSEQQIDVHYGLAEQIIPTIPIQADHSKNQPCGTAAPFNLVFIDPPYALNLWMPILNALTESKLVDADTLIYLEADKPIDMILPDSTYQDAITLIKSKKMGQVYAGLLTI